MAYIYIYVYSLLGGLGLLAPFFCFLESSGFGSGVGREGFRVEGGALSSELSGIRAQVAKGSGFTHVS